jgi:hypothetical protein
MESSYDLALTGQCYTRKDKGIKSTGACLLLKHPGIWLPTHGNHCTVFKSFEEGPQEKGFSFLPPSNFPPYWVTKPRAQELWANHPLSELPTPCLKGYFHFADKSIVAIFLLFVVLMLYLGQCPNLSQYTQRIKEHLKPPVHF